MPLIIKSTESKEANTILLPFAKNSQDNDLIRKYSGISYDPDLPLGAKDVSCFFHPELKLRIFVLGLGDEKDLSKSYLYFRSFVYQQRAKNDLKLNVLCDHLTDTQLVNAIIGLRKGLLNNGTFKTNGNRYVEPEITVVLSKKRQKIAEKALVTVDTQISAMFLVDLPSNVKTPVYIGKYAAESGKMYGYNVKVYDEKQLKKMELDALLAVGQGSANPPVLIVMEYKPKGSKSKSPVLGLVGKGISFDTGGISIKPSVNMGYMKCDMAGAAAVKI